MNQIGGEAVKGALHEVFEGAWRLEREIPDVGHATGSAHFEMVAERTAHYREDLILQLGNGARYRASREYRYDFFDDAIQLYYRDGPKSGEPFILLARPLGSALGPRSLEGIHTCGLDSYRGTVTLLADDRFTLQFLVEGPRKDLRILSHFRRQTPPYSGSAVPI
jgi:hypothetical protein